MQRITFTTVSGKSTTITDVNTSKRSNGTYLPVHLVGFDPNSVAGMPEAYERTGQDGAGIYGAKLGVRSIQVDLAFVPQTGGEKDMYDLRREVLKAFPINEQGLLTYNNGGDEYQINCMLTEYPAIERRTGKLCTTTIYLTAYGPHWRRKAEDITLTASADNPRTLTFTSNTEYKTPVCIRVTCKSTIVPPEKVDNRQAVEITLTGRDYKNFYGFDERGQIVRQIDFHTGRMYIANYMHQDNYIQADWGILNKFSLEASLPTNHNDIDFIQSNGLYIYPGSNTLRLEVNGLSGEVEAHLIMFDYVKAV